MGCFTDEELHILDNICKYCEKSNIECKPTLVRGPKWVKYIKCPVELYRHMKSLESTGTPPSFWDFLFNKEVHE